MVVQVRPPGSTGGYGGVTAAWAANEKCVTADAHDIIMAFWKTIFASCLGVSCCKVVGADALAVVPILKDVVLILSPDFSFLHSWIIALQSRTLRLLFSRDKHALKSFFTIMMARNDADRLGRLHSANYGINQCETNTLSLLGLEL
mmetsp:Transcript_28563/g.53725  ORF Transcript_28563/g.53725 Transcript_28563/m.53725 type:complete len:146 (-) Transcript_28563:40-477(-)